MDQLRDRLHQILDDYRDGLLDSADDGVDALLEAVREHDQQERTEGVRRLVGVPLGGTTTTVARNIEGGN